MPNKHIKIVRYRSLGRETYPRKVDAYLYKQVGVEMAKIWLLGY
ncbi:MAG: hypothetical protein ABW139_21095 [Candidatus Thiodiazotropha sp. DIVDIV]